MSEPMEPVGPEYRALSPEEKIRVFSAWAVRREAELEAENGPVTDDGLGLRKARVPVSSEVTWRLRPDGTQKAHGTDRLMINLHDEAVALGYRNGQDFAVRGIPAELSSEVVELGKQEGVYHVWHRDMGRRYDVASSSSPADVRREFLLELGRLAGPRGRGPYASEPAPQRGEDLTREQLIEQILRRPKDVEG
ncbi:hypothetical protein [Cellulomonas pakistanensis]|uniref:Uncharacterized protein n=1 Tax=Cellulomonas pakistanensis TaxID=992287 RepID=A0A919U6G0_9CELL|nr:hypothetical protein [Cellulomonas pakistanensis]GIG36220.1 hypothetical protein Cpa01nite_16010 [Cellulomonas pakistanensis]